MNVNTFLCEEIADATYGRQNLLGANFSDSVTVPEFPYFLHTTFFSLINLEAGESAKKIDLELFINDVSKYKISIDGPQRAEKKYNVRIAWSRLEILLESAGSLEVRAIVDGVKFCQKWNVLVGPGALRSVSGGLPSALLIDARAIEDNPLAQLVKEARSEILIADQYVTYEFLHELMSGQAKNLQVKIITNEKFTTKEKVQKLMSDFQNLEIRFNRLFHDRLVVRDTEEIYVFGASLKDVLHKRISFFQRLFDHHQTTTTLTILNECWKNAVSI